MEREKREGRQASRMLHYGWTRVAVVTVVAAAVASSWPRRRGRGDIQSQNLGGDETTFPARTSHRVSELVS
jgi:hypothetical protein